MNLLLQSRGVADGAAGGLMLESQKSPALGPAPMFAGSV